MNSPEKVQDYFNLIIECHGDTDMAAEKHGMHPNTPYKKAAGDSIEAKRFARDWAEAIRLGKTQRKRLATRGAKLTEQRLEKFEQMEVEDRDFSQERQLVKECGEVSGEWGKGGNNNTVNIDNTQIKITRVVVYAVPPTTDRHEFDLEKLEQETAVKQAQMVKNRPNQLDMRDLHAAKDTERENADGE